MRVLNVLSIIVAVLSAIVFICVTVDIDVLFSNNIEASVCRIKFIYSILCGVCIGGCVWAVGINTIKL